MAFIRLSVLIKMQEDEIHPQTEDPGCGSVTENQSENPFPDDFELIYDYSLASARDFVGREWIIGDIQRWVDNDAVTVLEINSEINVGKTALVAYLIENVFSDVVTAYHFFSRRYEDYDDLKKCIRSLAVQLYKNNNEYQEYINENVSFENITERFEEYNPKDLFYSFIIVPFQEIQPETTTIILIDAIDQCDQKDEFIDLISHISDFPQKLKILFTCRTGIFCNELSHILTVSLDLKEENESDLKRYFDAKIRLRPDFQGKDELLDELSSGCNGDFFLARLICRKINRDQLQTKDEILVDLPFEYHSLIKQEFDSVFSDNKELFNEKCAPVLQILTASMNNVSAELLNDILQDRNCLDVFYEKLGEWSSFSETCLSPVNQMIAEWLTDEKSSGSYYIDALKGHDRIASYWEKAISSEQKYQYIDRYLIYHVTHSDLEEKEQIAGHILEDPHFFFRNYKKGMSRFNRFSADMKEINPDFHIFNVYNEEYINKRIHDHAIDPEIIFSLGRFLYLNKEISRSNIIFKSLADRFERGELSDLQLLKIKTYGSYAMILLQTKHKEEAENYLNRCYNLSLRLPDKKRSYNQQIISMGILGLFYLKIKKPYKAVKTFKEEEQLHEEYARYLGRPINELLLLPCYQNMAKAYMKIYRNSRIKDDKENARKYLSMAMDELEKLIGSGRYTMLHYIAIQAFLYQKLADYTNAQNTLDTGITLAKKQYDTINLSKMYNTKSDILSLMRKFEEAKEYADMNIDLMREYKNDFYLVYALRKKIVVMKREAKKDYDKEKYEGRRETINQLYKEISEAKERMRTNNNLSGV